MPSNHLIFYRPLLLLPSIFPSIRAFPASSFFRAARVGKKLPLAIATPPPPSWAVLWALSGGRLFLAPSQQGVRAGGGPALSSVLHAPRGGRVGLPEVTVSMCILSIFSRVCTAGTWPVHRVCSSYLVGCVICGGVAKGSGNVDSFQHNHMNLPPPAPALPPAHPTRCQGAAGVGRGRGPALHPHRPVSTTRSPSRLHPLRWQASSRLGKQAAPERGRGVQTREGGAGFFRPPAGKGHIPAEGHPRA